MSSNLNAKRSQMWPLAEAVRAYVVPIDRNSGTTVPFDPSAQGEFDLDAPPQPFLDVGWVENFQRTSATKYETLRVGPQSTLTSQFRAQFDAGVEFDLPNWGKLQMALAGGGQQINVLATSVTSPLQSSGGAAIPASYVQDGATIVELPLAADQLENFQVGDMVAVDWDYRGETGYVGSGAPGAYVAAPLEVPTHVDFVRRVTFNVSRVASKSAYSLLLAERLMGGAQTGMGVQRVAALLDREGGSYFQEWAALFVVVGGTGGRACFYYPRLQAAAVPARPAIKLRRRCSIPCCTRNCGRCRQSIRTMARRCCAIAATFRGTRQWCSSAAIRVHHRRREGDQPARAGQAGCR